MFTLLQRLPAGVNMSNFIILSTLQIKYLRLCYFIHKTTLNYITECKGRPPSTNSHRLTKSINTSGLQDKNIKELFLWGHHSLIYILTWGQQNVNQHRCNTVFIIVVFIIDNKHIPFLARARIYLLCVSLSPSLSFIFLPSSITDNTAVYINRNI